MITPDIPVFLIPQPGCLHDALHSLGKALILLLYIGKTIKVMEN